MANENTINNGIDYSTYNLIDSMNIETPNNRCKDEVSLRGTSGNYEARMHVYKEGDKTNAKADIEAFFNEFSKDNVYTFDKKNLLEYLNEFKFEFEFQVVYEYNDVSLEYWQDKVYKVENFKEDDLKFHIDSYKFDSQKRYYIGSSDKIFSSFKGQILLPKISTIIIKKYENPANGKFIYVFELGIADQYIKKVQSIKRMIEAAKNDKIDIDVSDENDAGNIKLYDIDFSQGFEIKDLYFQNKKLVEEQISKALKAGKHIILTGPPGTGKSKLAKQICEHYDVKHKMTTAISDWSSYETVGGYKLNKDGTLYFDEGIFLSCFKDSSNSVMNKWLIIDEMNRADIDKAFGVFFSTLTGDSVSLSFKDDDNKSIEIINQKDIDIKNVDKNQYVIPNGWRLIGTINTFDKTSLFEMSYAFMRRFAFIPISVPKDIEKVTVEEYLKVWGINNSIVGTITLADGLKELWGIINKYRTIGPAILKDIASYIENEKDYVSAIILYVLPQFEGIDEDNLEKFIVDLTKCKISSFNANVEQLNTFVEEFFGLAL